MTDTGNSDVQTVDLGNENIGISCNNMEVISWRQNNSITKVTQIWFNNVIILIIKPKNIILKKKGYNLNRGVY